MGDMGDDFREMNQMKRDKHAEMKVINTDLITAQNDMLFTITNAGECISFREHGNPAVDFYPSSGRWRMVGKAITDQRTFNGGAQSFLNWYRKRRVWAYMGMTAQSLKVTDNSGRVMFTGGKGELYAKVKN